MKSGRTIQAMAAEIRRQGEVKADYMVDTRCLRMEIWDGHAQSVSARSSAGWSAPTG